MLRPAYGWVREEARAVGKFAKGTLYDSAALDSGIAMAVWIKSNETAVRQLIDTLGGNSALRKIIDLVIEAVSKPTSP